MAVRPKPLMLMVLDGWGWRPERTANAIELGRTPFWHELLRAHSHTLLAASGEAVGLPAGTMGNSEVGHLTIGAGRVVFQDFTRISRAIRDGSFFQNEILGSCFRNLARTGGALHLMGLCSDIGVHAHIDHLFALIDFAARAGVMRIFIHAFTDGRDSPPDSGKGYLAHVQAKAAASGVARIATVMGRYYAMDRDKRWDRIHLAYDAIVHAKGPQAGSAAEAIERSYAAGVTDEFVIPTVIADPYGPVARLRDNDAVVFFNFRSDRARQLTRALALPDFAEFPRPGLPRLASYICMTEYDETFKLPIAFPSVPLTHLFGEVIAEAGLTQLRIAETEKYAHVTFFFNGGEEKLFPGEDRCLIPSPRDVPTYDKKPEMSADLVADEVLRRIATDAYDVIILNFANGDMVGHSGILKAAIRAAETVDRCLGRIVPAVLRKGGVLLITADHGNCEEMAEPDGKPMTAHSLNPVPFVFVAGGSPSVRLRDNGGLSDIAPTMLSLLGIPKPPEMTGTTLLLPG